MQELEFRVWLHDKGYMEVAHFDGGKWESDDGVFSLRVCEGDFVELCTGLKDKNGKKIYEGDIVRIDSMDELRVGYVELVADQYCIVCGEDEEGCKIVAEFYYYSKPEENCEVIGNIHENAELLG